MYMSKSNPKEIFSGTPFYKGGWAHSSRANYNFGLVPLLSVDCMGYAV